MLKIVYTFFLGLLLALFVGLGIATFYPGPKAPEYPVPTISTRDNGPSDDQLKAERDFSEKQRQYQDAYQSYNRNVSVIAVVAAVILMVVSLVFEQRIKIIADGVLLGGLFLVLYSIGRGFASEDTKYTFAVVAVGVAVALYLGYHRFLRVPAPAKLKGK
jgi:hypothetical protein